MALPQAAEAKPFYRSALQRFEDAEILLHAARTTGAIYLAGYGVECILKASLLSILPAAARQGMLASFRGARAHDFDWLLKLYSNYGGPALPPMIINDFKLVSHWTTSLRYSSGAVRRRDADTFFRAARAIMDFVDGRL